MEMETAHLTIKEVGMEFLNWVGSMWLRERRWGLRKSLPSPSDPLPHLVHVCVGMRPSSRLRSVSSHLTTDSPVPQMEWALVDNSMGFRLRQGLNLRFLTRHQLSLVIVVKLAPPQTIPSFEDQK